MRPRIPKPVLAWCALSLLLGLALALMEPLQSMRVTTRILEEMPDPTRGAGVALSLLAALFLAATLWRRDAFSLEGRGLPERVARRPYLTLFLVSFATLFLEVMLIRYTGSQIRIFSFYKNIPLISAFLGLGIGCWLGRARPRHALSFVLWLIPLTFFLAFGSRLVSGFLGEVAAQTSSEVILGDATSAERLQGLELVRETLWMGVFCVTTLVAITLLFTLLGRLLGSAFEDVRRIPGYTVNIVASLAGVLAFAAMSFFWVPPWSWYVVGLLPLLWWIPDRRRALLAVALMAVSVAAVVPQRGDVVWSAYQRLVGHEIPAGPEGTGTPSSAYMVQISDVFYQIAIDQRPEVVGERASRLYPHYTGVFSGIEDLDAVLIVGSGLGNDVAGALRAGAERVDAVDIDRAIVEMGREHHPEDPYDDPRVRSLVDDARSAFRKLPPKSYDAVVFGLLDSHTQLGMSSVRLDNYVFTRESFAAAARLLEPGGYLIVTAAVPREWFHERFLALVGSACDTEVEVGVTKGWSSYRCRVLGEEEKDVTAESRASAEVVLPTDDWPFLYLPTRSIPAAYLLVVLLLVAASWLLARVCGLRIHRFTPYHAHLFFLGAAFLLMEVVAINRLALLFGTTWIVSAVTIALVLLLIVAANLTVLKLGEISYVLAYAALGLSLLAAWAVPPSIALGAGWSASFAYGLLVLSPIFFAGLIFARSFRRARQAGAAIGANILGAAVGGWLEYGTLLTGIRAMLLLALALYLLSLFALLRSRDAAQSDAAEWAERDARSEARPDAGSAPAGSEPVT